MTEESIDWRTVAKAYRKRLHDLCLWLGIVAYLGSGVLLSWLLQRAHVSASWDETIALFVWIPLGASAWWLKGRLESWGDRDLPCP